MIFSGKRRPTIKKVCACGCGKTFRTTFPDKTTINDAHRKRLSRRRSPRRSQPGQVRDYPGKIKMFKIQTRAIDKPGLAPADDELKQWQDLENMPELYSQEEGEAWLQQPALQTLQELGFEFQIVPA
jgi:hypothetical protein